MSMRMSISPAAMAVLAGCGMTATTEYTAADQAVPVAEAADPTGDTVPVRCPDPNTDCTHSNGTGVFFEEHGDAGINAPGANIMFMITAFTNHEPTANSPGSVTFQGRYAAILLQGIPWLLGGGQIDSADYPTALGPQTGLQVVKVSEDHTIPTWTLVDPQAPKVPIPVTDKDLLLLQLHVTFFVVSPALTPVHVVLDFSKSDIIYDKDPEDHVFYSHPVLHAYNLRWRPEGAPRPSAIQYCVRGPSNNHADDEVVFQRGISVDPVTGTVTPDSSVVTMSCAWGGVAKAYNWGYAYVDPKDGTAFNPDFYKAAIYMKRASYCGDSKFYTVDGVRIGILDNLPKPVNTPPAKFVLEARWDTQGATCVNLDYLRIPGSFDGQCPGKPKLMKCDPNSGPNGGPMDLEDYTPPPPPAPPSGP